MQTRFIKGARAATTYANRGMDFEAALNDMHAAYAGMGLAQVTKQYLPSLPVKDGKWAKIIGRSTVDYTGTLTNGRHVAFDAKDCREKRIELARLQLHQFGHLMAAWDLGAIAFVLVRFERKRVYAIPAQDWYEAVRAHEHGGKASIAEKECKPEWAVDGYNWERTVGKWNF